MGAPARDPAHGKEGRKEFRRYPQHPVDKA
jgi:hypothetical protein